MTARMVRCRVAGNQQIVSNDGTVYRPGDEFTAELHDGPAVVHTWLGSRWHLLPAWIRSGMVEVLDPVEEKSGEVVDSPAPKRPRKR